MFSVALAGFAAAILLCPAAGFGELALRLLAAATGELLRPAVVMVGLTVAAFSLTLTTLNEASLRLLQIQGVAHAIAPAFLSLQAAMLATAAHSLVAAACIEAGISLPDFYYVGFVWVWLYGGLMLWEMLCLLASAVEAHLTTPLAGDESDTNGTSGVKRLPPAELGPAPDCLERDVASMFKSPP